MGKQLIMTGKLLFLAIMLVSLYFVFSHPSVSVARDPATTITTVTILKGAWQYDEDPTNDYSPNTLEVKIGTTVTWTNEDYVPHTITKDGVFDSGLLDQGESWSYAFDEAGTYEYYCIPHPWMKGKVIVLNSRN